MNIKKEIRKNTRNSISLKVFLVNLILVGLYLLTILFFNLSHSWLFLSLIGLYCIIAISILSTIFYPWILPFKKQVKIYIKNQEENFNWLEDRKIYWAEKINETLAKEPLSIDPFPEIILDLKNEKQKISLSLQGIKEAEQDLLKKIIERHNSLYFNYFKNGQELALQEKISSLKNDVISKTKNNLNLMEINLRNIEEEENNLPKNATKLKEDILKIYKEAIEKIEFDCTKTKEKISLSKNL
jgi:hypothetical protein